MNQDSLHVLLIEDNDDDIFLMRRAVKRSSVPWSMSVVTDGQAALDFFSGAGQYTDRDRFPLPALVFLDLKLPYVSGFDVLAAMQSQERVKEIPVIVLTSSPEERDQRRVLELGAKAYLIKPPTEELMRKVAGGDWIGLGQTNLTRGFH